MNRVYSLSNIEFFTLLTTIQKKEFWSFCGNNASFGQKEYNEGIFLLYRREILGRVDDFFLLHLNFKE
ncbi:hypothetical protein CIY_34200 [Butyrivibrio fibrisolvens 16/4]|nr:hypothetical protein CIY_34200 [Butyrivibrio fibrisolvens 16/4]